MSEFVGSIDAPREVSYDQLWSGRCFSSAVTFRFRLDTERSVAASLSWLSQFNLDLFPMYCGTIEFFNSSPCILSIRERDKSIALAMLFDFVDDGDCVLDRVGLREVRCEVLICGIWSKRANKERPSLCLRVGELGFFGGERSCFLTVFG